MSEVLSTASAPDRAADPPLADPPLADPAPLARPAFAHASEAELARILDFYAVRWEYEPHVFPIQWNLEGAVVESFSPDFYLPDFEQYVELTTLRQPLVRKKNRKLRRLRELYPDVRIKLFYARDFRALMLKYGKGALLGALSGTSGQVMPVVDPAPVAPVRAGDSATAVVTVTSTRGSARRARRNRSAAATGGTVPAAVATAAGRTAPESAA